jgi:hypothetical protein
VQTSGCCCFLRIHQRRKIIHIFIMWREVHYAHHVEVSCWFLMRNWLPGSRQPWLVRTFGVGQ